MSARVVCCLMMFALVLGALTQAQAQEQADTPSAAQVRDGEYLRTIESAVQAYEAGDLISALTQFERAHALEPSARTLRALGAVELDLGRSRDAAKHLTEALRSTHRPLEGALRQEAERLLARALRGVAVLELTGAPAHGALRLNGWPVEQPSQHFLDPGNHLIEGEADGYRPYRRTVRLAPGERRTLHVALTSALEPERSRLTPVLIGVGTAGLASGAALLIAARVNENQVEDATSGRWQDVASSHARAPKLAKAGYALSGVSLLGLGAAIGLHLWRAEDRRGRVQVAALPRGVSLTGAF